MKFLHFFCFVFASRVSLGCAPRNWTGPASTQSQAEAARIVAHGVVTAQLNEYYGLFTTITLEVYTYFKGCGPATITVNGFSHEDECGISAPTVGDESIVYLRDPNESGEYSLSYIKEHSGEQQASQQNIDEVIEVTGQGIGPDQCSQGCEEVSGYDVFESLGGRGGECSNGTSFESCNDACDADSDCIAFDYGFESQSCCTWESIVTGLSPMDGTCTYISYPPADCPGKSGFDTYANLGQNGGTCFSVRSLGTCKTRCREDESCVAFDFIERSGCCIWSEEITELKLFPGICTYITRGTPVIIP